MSDNRPPPKETDPLLGRPDDGGKKEHSTCAAPTQALGLLVALNAVVFALKTVDGYEWLFTPSDVLLHRSPAFALEVLSTVIFSIDAALRFLRTPRRTSGAAPFFFLVDVVAVVPSLLRLSTLVPQDVPNCLSVRVLRLLEVFAEGGRFGEAGAMFGGVIVGNAHMLITSGFVGGTTWVVVGTLYWLAERRNPDVDGRFATAPSSLWFSMCNLLGEYPVTDAWTGWGKTIGTGTVVVAVAVFAIPTGIIGAGILDALCTKRASEDKADTFVIEVDVPDDDEGPKELSELLGVILSGTTVVSLNGDPDGLPTPEAAVGTSVGFIDGHRIDNPRHLEEATRRAEGSIEVQLLRRLSAGSLIRWSAARSQDDIFAKKLSGEWPVDVMNHGEMGVIVTDAGAAHTAPYRVARIPSSQCRNALSATPAERLRMVTDAGCWCEARDVVPWATPDEMSVEFAELCASHTDDTWADDVLVLVSGKSRLGRVFNTFVTVVIALNVAETFYSTIPSERCDVALGHEGCHGGWQRPPLGTLHTVFQACCVGLFTVDYCLRLYAAGADRQWDERGDFRRQGLGTRRRLRYVVSAFAIVDALSILPWYIDHLLPWQVVPTSLFRVFRLLRMLNADKYVSAFSLFGEVWSANADLLAAGGVIGLVLWLLFSMLMYYAERDGPDGPDGDTVQEFVSIPSAMWIVLLNLSGEYPLADYTIPGRLISGVSALVAMSIFSIPTGIFGSGFEAALDDQRRREQRREQLGVACCVCSRDVDGTNRSWNRDEATPRSAFLLYFLAHRVQLLAEIDQEIDSGRFTFDAEHRWSEALRRACLAWQDLPGSSAAKRLYRTEAQCMREREREEGIARAEAASPPMALRDVEGEGAALAMLSPLSSPANSRRRGVRAAVWRFLSPPTQGAPAAARVFEDAVLVLIMLNIVGFAASTDPAVVGFAQWVPAVLDGLEFVSMAFFTVEYLLRVWSSGTAEENSTVSLLPCCRGRSQLTRTVGFLTSFFGLVDLLCIAPFWADFFEVVSYGATTSSSSSLFRVVRLMRLLKGEKYAASITLLDDVFRDKAPVLAASGFVAAVCVVVFSYLLHLTERDNTEQVDDYYKMADYYRSAPSALFTTFLHLTGDYPLYQYSTLGRVVNFVMILLGVGLVGVPMGVIAAGFEEKVVEGRVAKEEEEDKGGDEHVAESAYINTICERQRVLRAKAEGCAAVLLCHLEGDTAAGRCVNVVLATIPFVSVAAWMADTGHWESTRTLWWLTLCTTIVFAVEYVIRVAAAGADPQSRRSSAQYLVSTLGLIHAVALVPGIAYLTVPPDWAVRRPLCALTVLQMLKMEQYIEAFTLMDNVFRAHRHLLVTTTLGAVIVWIGGAGLLYVTEAGNPEVDGAFDTLPLSLFYVSVFLGGEWAIVNFTAAGKVVAVAIALFGIPMFAVPAGIFFAGFEEIIDQRKADAEQWPELCCETKEPIKHRRLLRLRDP